MVSVCFYFQVHQPYRVRKYGLFDMGSTQYFDNKKNREVCKKVEKKCYLPMNRLLLERIHKMKGDFKVSFSISGTALEQFEQYSPRVLESFKKLADTGCVEFISETYHHSLSFLYSKEEFLEQVCMHKKKLKEHFKATPQVFRNTELVYTNELAKFIEKKGYKAVLAEGADHVLGWRSPNYPYTPTGCKKLKLLLKNYKLSDDIAFRFSNKGWNEWPLTVNKYCQWLNAANRNGNVVNLFMDYETFGEHQWKDTGIFKFMGSLPQEVLKHPDNNFMTVSEVAETYPSIAKLDIPGIVSWADTERDMSAWTGNKMQQAALHKVFALEKAVKKSRNKDLLDTWRKLTTSDHFYYMCTKWFSDGDVHKYFNPYDSPYDGFIHFMNILENMEKDISQGSLKVPLMQSLLPKRVKA
jgi:alpha-amylase